MVPEGEKEAVFNALLAHLDSIGNHFDTGIMATPLLLKALSDNGRADIAFRLMNQREIPGFGYVMDDRYSCLWERWEGIPLPSDVRQCGGLVLLDTCRNPL